MQRYAARLVRDSLGQWYGDKAAKGALYIKRLLAAEPKDYNLITSEYNEKN